MKSEAQNFDLYSSIVGDTEALQAVSFGLWHVMKEPGAIFFLLGNRGCPDVLTLPFNICPPPLFLFLR